MVLSQLEWKNKKNGKIREKDENKVFFPKKMIADVWIVMSVCGELHFLSNES